MSTKTLYPAIVVWEDIVSTDSNWREVDDAIDWADSEPSLVAQVGFVVEKNDEHIILVDSYFPGTDTVGTTTKIPMSVVKNIIKLPFDVEATLEAIRRGDE